LLLGVTGGIAAYRAADLTSAAVKAGYDVRVVMTDAATRFIAPLTFEALSMHAVMVDTFHTGPSADGVGSIDHVSWAKWADIALIAPLTASTLGKLACGVADNALTTTWLALPASAPQLLAPAMNTQMWDHPIVQRNRRWLEETGRFHFVEPVAKRLACGDVGVGGLASTDDLLAAVVARTLRGDVSL